MACHDVGQIPKGLRGVAVRSDVDVDSAAAGGVALGSGLPEDPDQFLQGGNVGVVKDRGDQFALLIFAALDADVALEFPFAVLCVPCAPGAVAVAVGGVFVASGAEELGGKLRSLAAGDAVHLDLDSDGLLFHFLDLAQNLLVHCVFLRFL